MKNKKTKILLGVIVIILLIALVYVSNIIGMPNSIVLFENENINFNTVFGVNVEKINYTNLSNYKTIQTSTGESKNNTGTTNLAVNLFGLKVKEISVNVIENTEVVPLGNIAGLKLYTSGVLVVGMSEIYGYDANKYRPYENSEIKEGDMIVEIDKKIITSTNELIKCVNSSNGKEIKITYIRDGKIQETSMKPVKTQNNTFKLGLWVRDTAAGVGTVTFYDPETEYFASLGHGIVDADTEKLVDISTGEFTTTEIVSITKGENGNPGRIQGTLDGQSQIGTIYKNTPFGVYGKITNIYKLNINKNQKVKIALRDEIQTGKASIICTLQNNVRDEYEVEIQKIYLNNNIDNKSMLIKVTDKELLEKTGGIIQGMSGSPILQDGKLIGALTHVLVSDPTKGYGVFAELMVKEMKKINN